MSTPTDVIVVLAHLMEKDGTLGIESRVRADRAADLSRLNNRCPIILMGWSYRDDTDLCISDAIASYLKLVHQIDDGRLFIDRESRDTVGDAILSKEKFFNLIELKNVMVVTSDYHVERAQKVFKFVYANTANITVCGIETEKEEKKLIHENNSLHAFSQTFSGVESGDDQSIFNALIRRHPFYNGEIYPVLDTAKRAKSSEQSG